MQIEHINQTMPNGEIVEIVNIFDDKHSVSMLKSVYDEQQEHLQTIVPQVDETSAE